MEKQQRLQQPVLTKQSGFTLIELVAVVIIIVILSAAYITLVSPDNGAGIRINNTANQIATDIRLTQSLAMSLNQRRQVNFSTASYSVTDTANNPAWLNSGSIVLNSMMSITSTTPSSIIFNGRGVPYSSSTTPLASTFQVILQTTGGGNQRTISVSPTTGSVGVSNP